MFLTAEKLLAEFRGNAPCERAIIEQTEKECGFAFPDDYEDLLLRQKRRTGIHRAQLCDALVMPLGQLTAD